MLTPGTSVAFDAARSESRLPERTVVSSALVVDDDLGIATVVREVLTGLDCRVLVASSLEEAVAAFRSGPTHFSILDVHVRDRTGFEILRELRSYRQDHPAIFMSGEITDETRRMAGRLSAFPLLDKPLRLGALREAVGPLLRSGRNGTP
jgi:DNA-binding response OmpR family regulator